MPTPKDNAEKNWESPSTNHFFTKLFREPFDLLTRCSPSVALEAHPDFWCVWHNNSRYPQEHMNRPELIMILAQTDTRKSLAVVTLPFVLLSIVNFLLSFFQVHIRTWLSAWIPMLSLFCFTGSHSLASNSHIWGPDFWGLKPAITWAPSPRQPGPDIFSTLKCLVNMAIISRWLVRTRYFKIKVVKLSPSKVIKLPVKVKCSDYFFQRVKLLGGNKQAKKSKKQNKAQKDEMISRYCLWYNTFFTFVGI